MIAGSLVFGPRMLRELGMVFGSSNNNFAGGGSKKGVPVNAEVSGTEVVGP